MEDDPEGIEVIAWRDNFTRVCIGMHIAPEAGGIGLLYRWSDIWLGGYIETIGEDIE